MFTILFNQGKILYIESIECHCNVVRFGEALKVSDIFDTVELVKSDSSNY